MFLRAAPVIGLLWGANMSTLREKDDIWEASRKRKGKAELWLAGG